MKFSSILTKVKSKSFRPRLHLKRLWTLSKLSRRSSDCFDVKFISPSHSSRAMLANQTQAKLRRVLKKSTLDIRNILGSSMIHKRNIHAVQNKEEETKLNRYYIYRHLLLLSNS